MYGGEEQDLAESILFCFQSGTLPFSVLSNIAWTGAIPSLLETVQLANVNLNRNAENKIILSGDNGSILPLQQPKGAAKLWHALV